MSYVADELRRARREIVRLNRRVAMMEMSGPVAERDPQKRRVRIELGEDPEGGGKILSPWVRVQSTSAGAFKGFVLPSVGEQMTLHSASGVVGGDSVARFGTFTDQNPHPDQDADEAVIAQNGTTRLTMKAGELKFTVAGVSQTVSAAGVKLQGGKITHDDRNIGSDHKHGGIQSGGAKTTEPE